MLPEQIIVLLTFIALAIWFLYIVYYAIGLYQLNPFIKIKPLSYQEQQIIANNFPIYRKLPQEYKERCHQRITWFRSKKKFVFYGGVEQKEAIELILSATAVLMTLGLKNYKMLNSLLRIVIYPSQFYSRINRRHHLGEYNPVLKMVVFSAEKIKEGFNIGDDNLNLAVHELAHALSFEMIRQRSWEARRFKVGLKKIKELFKQEVFGQKMVNSTYFRAYGKTNLQEFFSVATENYVETPEAFSKEFPQLYIILQQMLNFDFQHPPRKQKLSKRSS